MAMKAEMAEAKGQRGNKDAPQPETNSRMPDGVSSP